MASRGAVGTNNRVGDRGGDSSKRTPFHTTRGAVGKSENDSGPRQISAINGLSVYLAKS